MTLLWWRQFLFGNRTMFRPRKWQFWTWVHTLCQRLFRHGAFSLLPGVLFCGKHWLNCWALPQAGAGASAYCNYDKWLNWLTYDSHQSHASSSAEATVGHRRCSRFWLKMSWPHHVNHVFNIFARMQIPFAPCLIRTIVWTQSLLQCIWWNIRSLSSGIPGGSSKWSILSVLKS